MEVDTWLSAVNTKDQLIALITLVEEGSLEELFVAQCVDTGVAGQEWPVGQVLVFSFSTSNDIEQKLQAISSCINLDTLDEKYFDVVEGDYMLKHVFYPESEPQEEQIIAHLR